LAPSSIEDPLAVPPQYFTHAIVATSIKRRGRSHLPAFPHQADDRWTAYGNGSCLSEAATGERKWDRSMTEGHKTASFFRHTPSVELGSPVWKRPVPLRVSYG